MPNSQLKGKSFQIPDNIKNELKRNLKKLNSQDAGYNRIKNLLNSGKVSYTNLKRIKNFFDNNPDTKLTNKLKNWVNKTLNNARRGTYMPKRTQQDAGMPNKHKKDHHKDQNANPSNVNIPKAATSGRDIGKDRVNYENYNIYKKRNMDKRKVKLTEKELVNTIKRIVEDNHLDIMRGGVDIPEQKENPDWSSVRKQAKEIVESKIEGRTPKYVGPQLVLEEVLEALYGENIFDLLNKRT